MTRSSFPMSKSRSKAYRLGSAWRWRVVTFSAGGADYRLLVAFRTDKEQFMAKLGLDDSGDMKIVASLEFHGTHPGWHLHHPNMDISGVPPGVMRGPWVRRRECHGETEYGLDGADPDAKAFSIAAAIFGIGQGRGAGAML